MKTMRSTIQLMAAIVVLSLTAWHCDARAEDTAALAQAAQNPIANMISLPLQNNTNFGVGPGDDVQNILNIQPVVPFELTPNWNLITRTIAPLIYQPELVPGTGSEFGWGTSTRPCSSLRPSRANSSGAWARCSPFPRPPTTCWAPRNGARGRRWWR
jgi:hypothetical protein